MESLGKNNLSPLQMTMVTSHKGRPETKVFNTFSASVFNTDGQTKDVSSGLSWRAILQKLSTPSLPEIVQDLLLQLGLYKSIGLLGMHPGTPS